MDPGPLRPRLDALAHRWSAVRRLVLRRRRLFAVALVGVAVVAALRVLAPPEAPTTTVAVAAHDLPVGRVLTEGDLVDVEVPPDTVPDGVVATPQGHALATALRAGEPVTDVRLVGADLATAQPDGTLAAPVRLSDAGQAALLSAGDRIDLLATDPDGGSTRALAIDVAVLAVPESDGSAGGALPGRLVVVALPSADVGEVTAASVAGYVTYTWHRG
ncbi:MAG: SAF domain-containing protein [Nocardioidaceae bacterium]|nr:SAF domain-containing protein [Nocardioidaceae bacterium]